MPDSGRARSRSPGGARFLSSPAWGNRFADPTPGSIAQPTVSGTSMVGNMRFTPAHPLADLALAGMLSQPTDSTWQRTPRPAPPLPGPKPQTHLNNDAKSALNKFLQKALGRPVTKDDTFYNTASLQDAAGYQSTLHLPCLDLSFAGDVQAAKKDAEQAAAMQALAHFNEGLATDAFATGAYIAQAQHAAAVSQLLLIGAGAPQARPSVNGDTKSILSRFVQKTVKRPTTKEDVVYETAQHPGEGFQSKVTLACFGTEYIGDVMLDQKSAERSAAMAALEQLGSDVSQMPLVSQLHPSGIMKERPCRQTTKFDGLQDSEKVMPAANCDAKSRLTRFLQKGINRPLTKADLVYETSSGGKGQGYQSRLDLPFLGLSFAGEVCADKKSAEQNAAYEALKYVSDGTNEGVPAEGPSTKKPRL